MLFWYAGGAVAAIAIGWIAAIIHLTGHAPVGLLSLGVGIALGAALYGIATTQGVAGRKPILIGTILLALVTVLAEHAWLYRDFRRQWPETLAKSPGLAFFLPESPWSPREYFTREFTPQRAALWCLDAVLITTAACGTVWVLHREHK